MVVEGFQVEGAVELDVAVVLDGVAQRGAVVKLGASEPGVGGVLLHVHLRPVQDGQLVERQLIRGLERLPVVKRRSPVD